MKYDEKQIIIQKKKKKKKKKKKYNVKVTKFRIGFFF